MFSTSTPMVSNQLLKKIDFKPEDKLKPSKHAFDSHHIDQSGFSNKNGIIHIL